MRNKLTLLLLNCSFVFHAFLILNPDLYAKKHAPLLLLKVLTFYWSFDVLSFCRRKKDEVQILEDTIRARNEQHKKAGIELDATCHICLKTKFADGVGHLCNYCSIRCCARCGGKVTLRSNKVNRSNVTNSQIIDYTYKVVHYAKK